MWRAVPTTLFAFCSTLLLSNGLVSRAAAELSPSLASITSNASQIPPPSSRIEFFPLETPPDSAQSANSIQLKTNAFYINGKPTFLVGASFQWFRMPPELWEDRLKRLKGMGMNAIDMYVSWRNHEPREGEFDFKTYDITGFLDLCKRHGVYVYFRPGPYITNELDGGGVPGWVFAKSTKAVLDAEHADGLINLRTQDKDFLDVTARYFSALNAVVKPYLITNGGPIVLYALENEYTWFQNAFDLEKCADYPAAGMPERTQDQVLDVPAVVTALRDMVRRDGVDVPITMCPGDNRISAMGDVSGIVPIPNIYVGFHNLEEIYYDVKKDMEQNHGGIYRNMPTGISETSIHTLLIKKTLLAGGDTVFLFNAVGFHQEDYQNCILLNGMNMDTTLTNLINAFKTMTDFRDPAYIRHAFVSPAVGYFPNTYDYNAAVSPSGLHREKYFSIRRANLFIQSFNHILANVNLPRRSIPYGNPHRNASDVDNAVIVNNKHAASTDSNLGKLYYWLKLGEATALLGLVHPGTSTTPIILPPRSVTAFGVTFPQYTKLAVSADEYSPERDPTPHRTNVVFVPVNFPLGDDGEWLLAYSTTDILMARASPFAEKETLLVLTAGRGLQHEFTVCANTGDESTAIDVAWKDAVVHEHPAAIKRGSNDACRTFVFTAMRVPTSVVLAMPGSDGRTLRVILLDYYLGGRTWAGTDKLIMGADYYDEETDVLELSVTQNGQKSLLYAFSPSMHSLSSVAQLQAVRPFNDKSLLTVYEHTPSSDASSIIPRDTKGLKSGLVYDETEDLAEIFEGKGAGADVEQSPHVGWKLLGNESSPLENNGIFVGHAWYQAQFDLSETAFASSDASDDENASIPDLDKVNLHNSTKDNDAFMEKQHGSSTPMNLWVEHASDFVGIYVNGEYVTTVAPMGTEINSGSPHPRYKFSVPSQVLREGVNTIAFRTEIWGHGSFMWARGALKRFTIAGRMVTLNPLNMSIPSLGYDSVRGVFGTASFANRQLREWRLRAGLHGQRVELFRPTWEKSDKGTGPLAVYWNRGAIPLHLKPGQMVWYRTSFTYDQVPDPDVWTAPLHLRIKGSNAKATVYLNGRLICRWLSDEEWIRRGTWVKSVRTLWTIADPDQCPIATEVLRRDVANELTILFEDAGTNYPGFMRSGHISDLALDLSTYEPTKRDALDRDQANFAERLVLS